MEERIIDNEREIKIKRKREGDDVVDALAEDGEELPEEEDVVLELPEDEYDEDMVGLTPTQLKEELARREKAKQEAEAECAKLTQAGEEKLQENDFAEAEKFFAQALLHVPESEAAGKGLWTARTKSFLDSEPLFNEEYAEELGSAPEAVRVEVIEFMGEGLKQAREEYRTEAEPLREKVTKEIEERRGPFEANRKYYSLRLKIWLAACVLMLIGIIVSSSFLYSVQGMLVVGLICGFGALCLGCLIAVIIYARKLTVATRYCKANEMLSSTDDGARLEYLEKRLHCLELILGE